LGEQENITHNFHHLRSPTLSQSSM